MKQLFKIRYNTDFPASSDYPWRVIEVKNNVWKEIVTMHVAIHCWSETSADTMPDGRIKFHISMQPAKVIYIGKQDEKSFTAIELFD